MFTLLLLHLAAAQLEKPSQDPAVCSGVPKTAFAHMADLPKGVLDALGEPMAEKDQPFQSTDVAEEPPLPRNSFRSAEQQGCAIRLSYVQGGRGQSNLTATFFLDDSGWKLIGRSQDRAAHP